MSDRIRSVTVNVPQNMTAVAFNLEAGERTSGPWRVAQAGLTGGAASVTITARFKPAEKYYRLLWVAEGGSTAGLEQTEAQPIEGANTVTSTGPLRKFNCGEADWLLEHGVDPKEAARFPRGRTLAEIVDALNG